MSDWQAEDSVGAKDGVVAEDGLFEATPEESAIVDEPDVVSVAERALSSVPPGAPLAVRMRPLTLGEVVGQQHLLGPGAPLRRMVEGSGAASVLLYGPPGTGKTTLASLISGATGRRFEALSALSAGVKEVRGVIELARRRLLNGEQTVLFIDEVHRFSKTQQDALLAAVENRIVLSENIQGSPTGTATQVAIYNLINSTPGSALGAARFFINGVDTETQGLDIVARYRLPTENAGRFDFTLASNFNNTQVTRIPTTRQLSALPVPPILFDRGNRLTFESGTPAQKYVASVDWTLDRFGVNAKATKYGSVLIPGSTNANAALDYRSGSAVVVDLEGRVDLPYGSTLAVGWNNLFDEYPNQTPTNVNTNGPIAFPSYSPFGFNGRFFYSRLSVKW